MNFIKTLSAILALALAINTQSVAQQWRHYFGIHNIYSLTDGNDYIYFGSEGRIVKVNRKNLTFEYLTPYKNPDNLHVVPSYISIGFHDSLNTLIAIPTLNENNWPYPQRLIKVKGSGYEDVFSFNTTGSFYGLCKPDRKLNSWMISNFYNGFTHFSYLIKINDTDTIIFRHNEDFVPPGYISWDEQFKSLDFSSVGSAWAGTDKGLVNIVDDSMIFHAFPANQFPYHTAITKLKIDKLGRKWCGLGGENSYSGLFLFENSNWVLYNTNNSALPSNTINAIDIDSKNIIWLATDKGLTLFNGSNWEVFTTTNSGLQSNNITDMVVDDADVKWLVIAGNRLVRFDGSNFTEIYPGTPAMGSNKITTLFVKNDVVYASGMACDVYRIKSFELTNWRYFDFLNASFNIISSILIDGETEYYGIFGWEKDNSGMIVKNLESVRFLTGANTPELTYPKYSQANVTALTLDLNRKLWMGIIGGLGKYDNGNWTTLTPTNSNLPYNNILDIDVDSKNQLWIAINGGGLSMFNGSDFKNHLVSNSGIPSNKVMTVEVDKQDNIWAGTAQKGLVKFDGTKWSNWITSNSGIPSNIIYSICNDANDVIWLGTDAGLVKFADGKFTTYDVLNSGLPVINDVYGVVTDKYNNIWIGSEAGISVFNENGIPSEIESTVRQVFSISPNPIKDQCVIKCKTLSDYNLKIYNSIGVLTMEKNYSNLDRIELNLGNLINGFYVLNISDQKSSAVGSQKIIICR